ncbi:MAG: hypothetical protein HN590_00860 [Calditrichaeota bacterium]|nr:hypothetical protein [Calditrichota bacterium]
MRHIAILLICLFLAPALFAEENKTYKQPVLLTSIGQAADILIMKGLCKRAGVENTMLKLAIADSIKDYKCIILVAGGSSKGLGAAKIDVSDEERRGKELVLAAQEAGIPILTFHIGGEARRGVLSDGFNKLAAEGAELIVVASDGDKDKLFRKAADRNHARYIHIEKSFGGIEVLKELFAAEGDPEDKD